MSRKYGTFSKKKKTKGNNIASAQKDGDKELLSKYNAVSRGERQIGDDNYFFRDDDQSVISQRFKCVYKDVPTNSHGFKQHLKMPGSSDLIFSIEAKLVCISCHNYSLGRKLVLWECNCGSNAYLHITLTNLGSPAKIDVGVNIEKNDLQFTKIFKSTMYVANYKNYQNYWHFPAFNCLQQSTSICHNSSLYYGGEYFSSSGNLILVCDIKVLEYEYPVTTARLASQFSEANINPTTVPLDLFTDVVLCVGEDRIHCHKLILGMSSRYFKRMFTSDLKESRSQEIELKEVDVETITSLISFMYKDTVDSEKINVNLLAAADMYEVLRLKSICCQTLSKSINFNNVVVIWQTAYLHSIKSLTHDALIYMAQNFKALKQREDVQELCEIYPHIGFTIASLLAEHQ